MPKDPAHKYLAQLVGNDRANHSIPLKGFLDNDVITTLSSDWDVSYDNPFIGLANALHRESESVSLKVILFV